MCVPHRFFFVEAKAELKFGQVDYSGSYPAVIVEGQKPFRARIGVVKNATCCRVARRTRMSKDGLDAASRLKVKEG